MSNPIQNSPCIAAGASFLFNKCPEAKAEGASGSQVSPDFSARPAGLWLFLVYRKYTLPLRNSFKSRFWYTHQYTTYIKYCLTAN